MATWAAIAGFSRSVQSSQVSTDAAPSAATDGALLTAVAALVPIITAPNGQTFTGAGQILGYYWTDVLGRWVRAPFADASMSLLAGLAEGALPGIQVQSGNGRFAWICSGVGLSGGTTITLTLVCAALQDGGAI